MALYRLKEICDIFDGPHATPPETEDGPIFLGIKNITEQCEIDLSDAKHLSEKDYVKWTKRVTPKKDDIVFSYEATLNRYALIPEGFYGCLGRRLAIVRVRDSNVVNSHYLYYYFCSPKWKSFIFSNKVVGSTVLRVSVEELPNYQIDLPDIEKQNLVAYTLDQITEKKKLNNSVAHTMQSLAKTIYDYWFVQFDFPDETGKPYKSSGGKMVWNEELKREIPEGWEVKPALDLFDWIGTSQPPKSTFSYTPKKGYVRFIQNRDYDGDNHLTYIPITANTRLCDEKDIMMDKYGDAGRTRFGISGAYNVALSKILAHSEGMREYIRSYLSSETIYEYLHSACIASTRASLNESNFSFLHVPVPPKTVLNKYNAIVEKSVDETLHLIKENQQLASLRDFLLPMLMNGQVTVEGD